LLIDVTLRPDFIGAGRSGLTQGRLRNPDNPDHILESTAADKIRNYRDPYHRNRQVAFLSACMSTSGRIYGEFLRLLFFLSNKQADDYFAALGYEAHKEEFVIAAASSSTATSAPSGWHVLGLWRCAATPPRSSLRPCPSQPAAFPPGRRFFHQLQADEDDARPVRP
jgi:hypothetical protein